MPDVARPRFPHQGNRPSVKQSAMKYRAFDGACRHPKRCLGAQPARHSLTLTPRKRNALKMTEAELRLIARAAIMGDNSQPVKGNSTPAASGTPSAL